MSIIKFRKVPELFPNRKVRTIRTEQLCVSVSLQQYPGTSIEGPIIDRFCKFGSAYQYIRLRNVNGAGTVTQQLFATMAYT